MKEVILTFEGFRSWGERQLRSWMLGVVVRALAPSALTPSMGWPGLTDRPQSPDPTGCWGILKTDHFPQARYLRGDGQEPGSSPSHLPESSGNSTHSLPFPSVAPSAYIWVPKWNSDYYSSSSTATPFTTTVTRARTTLILLLLILLL